MLVQPLSCNFIKADCNIDIVRLHFCFNVSACYSRPVHYRFKCIYILQMYASVGQRPGVSKNSTNKYILYDFTWNFILSVMFR